MSISRNGEVRPKTGLIQRVVAILRSEITTGNWPVGSRIPTEPELSKLTGVGRNTVREAVQSLVHTGLLERRQGSGTYVLANNEVVVQLSRYAESGEQDPAPFTEALGSMWVGACGLAAIRRNTRHREDLAEATLDLVGDPARLVSLDTGLSGAENDPRIHPVCQVILEASHSPMLTDLATGLLLGIGTHSSLLCPGNHLLACAQAVAAGDTAGATAAAQAVVDSFATQPHDEPADDTAPDAAVTLHNASPLPGAHTPTGGHPTGTHTTTGGHTPQAATPPTRPVGMPPTGRPGYGQL